MDQLLIWIRNLSLIAFLISVLERFIQAVINAIRVYIQEMKHA